MSDLLIRRQKFVRELRRKEVQNYMQGIRDKLMQSQTAASLQVELQEHQLELMKSKLEDENYSRVSVEAFLTAMSQYTTESLCNAYFFAIMEKALMHHLQFGQNSQDNKEIHCLAKEIVLRAIECPPNSNGKLPLEYCFKQILQILSNQDLEMLQIWKAISLLRTEVFFASSYRQFTSFLEHYPTDILEVLRTIFEVFNNFTATIEGTQKITLSMTDIFRLIYKLEVCFTEYTFGDEDIQLIMKILQNIIKLQTFQGVVELLAESRLFPLILEYLDEESKDLSERTTCQIIEFFAIAFSGQSQRIIKKHESIIPALTNFLPTFSTHSTFQMIVPNVEKWPKFNKELLATTLLCLSNIAACQHSALLMIKYNIINWIIAFSSCPEPHIRGELAILLFNIITKSSDEQTEILLEKNILNALNNVIREEYSVESMYYGLRALKLILVQAKSFPTNNLAWHFTGNTVAMHCQRLDLISYIEGLVISKKVEISKMAIICLELLEKKKQYQ